MNWGKGIALTLFAFAGLMAWFVVMAARNPEPLVTEQYYEHELKYQARIDNTSRANALAPVRMDLTAKSIRLTFPPAMHGRSITGQLTLLRPNDPTDDRELQVAPDSSGVFQAGALDLVPGRYNALLEWSADGVAYYTEEKLVVP
ncbi:MAG: FixH family protein [Flavobacteriales bacterium]